MTDQNDTPPPEKINREQLKGKMKEMADKAIDTREISLEEFISGENNRLTKFKEKWISQNKQDPENFPMNLLPGDWTEQYEA